MALLIAYESSVRRYTRALASGWDDSRPDLVAFSYPKEARAGDRVLLYVGGSVQSFVGSTKVISNWRTVRSGPWAGEPYIRVTTATLLSSQVKGARVAKATGLSIPTSEMIVPVGLVADVWKAARGVPIEVVERAMEGVSTEARSKQRNPKLRAAAMQRAHGTCQCCEVNYVRRHGELGRRVLVVHHKKQLRDRDEPAETKVSDLAVLCANCHMMIHQDPSKAMSVAQLRRKINAQK